MDGGVSVKPVWMVVLVLTPHGGDEDVCHAIWHTCYVEMCTLCDP